MARHLILHAVFQRCISIVPVINQQGCLLHNRAFIDSLNCARLKVSALCWQRATSPCSQPLTDFGSLLDRQAASVGRCSLKVVHVVQGNRRIIDEVQTRGDTTTNSVQEDQSLHEVAVVEEGETSADDIIADVEATGSKPGKQEQANRISRWVIEVWSAFRSRSAQAYKDMTRIAEGGRPKQDGVQSIIRGERPSSIDIQSASKAESHLLTDDGDPRHNRSRKGALWVEARRVIGRGSSTAFSAFKERAITVADTVRAALAVQGSLNDNLWSGLARNQSSVPFLPSLLSRVDPGVYASAWGRALEPPAPRPGDLYKPPQSCGEIWDTVVDDIKHFLTCLLDFCSAPYLSSSRYRPPPPVRGQADQRPKASKVRKGPLNAAPLVLKSTNSWSPPAYQRDRGDWVPENSLECTPEEQLTKQQIEEDGWEEVEAQTGDLPDRETIADVDIQEGKDSLDQAPSSDALFIREQSSQQRSPPAKTYKEKRKERRAAAAKIRAEAATAQARVLDPFAPSGAEFIDQPWMSLRQLPRAANTDSDSQETRESEPGVHSEDDQLSVPGWLGRLSPTRAILRPRTPAQREAIERRRAAVRRIPRKMDDNFLRTVSRKLQGNANRIREFQLQTDRYRNSLINTETYYDAVTALFGSSRSTDSIIVPLISLLPESSKRRALAEAYRTRKDGMRPRSLVSEPQSRQQRYRWSSRGFTGGAADLTNRLGKGVRKFWSGVITRLRGRPRELSIKQGSVGCNDAARVYPSPLQSFYELVGERDTDYLEMRVHLYKRGAITAIDLYKTITKICLSDSEVIGELVRLIEYDLAEGESDRALLLTRVHNGQKRL